MASCLVATGLLLLGGYIWFSRDRPVVLSYSGQNCVSNLTLLPNFYKSQGATYSTTTKDNLSLGGYPIISKRTCIEINKAPIENSQEKASLALLNLPVLKKNYKIMAGTHPRLDASVLDKTISVKEPLIFNLDKKDKVFGYQLQVGEKEASCQIAAAKMICPVEQLKLVHGEQYEAGIQKLFENTEIEQLAQSKIQTVDPVKIISTSVAPGGIVYNKPGEFKLTADKALSSAEAVLWQVKGSKKTKLESSVSVSGQAVTLRPTREMARAASYEIEVSSLTAEDKGSLVAAYKLQFKLSGGPKVLGLNIGKSSVEPSSTFTLTFDQKIAPGHNFSKLLSVKAGGVAVGISSSFSGNKLWFRLASIPPKCSTLQIRLAGKLTSVYQISGDENWNFNSRLVCHTLTTIGYSAQGRPVYAYRFGSGGSKILYVGTTHGNERGTKSLLDRWIDELNAYPGRIPAGRTIIVVPNLNPDGYAAGNRRNARNVDLNRNFPTSDWKANVTMPGGELVVNGGGKSALSETESKAIANLVKSEKPRLILTYHSVASLVSANGTGDSSALAAKYASLSGYNNLPASQINDVFHYDTTGSFEDWAGDKEGRAALLVELSSHSSSDFSRNIDAMWTMASLP